MKFADILKEAFVISWRFKWFWLAGFLIYPQLIGGYPTNFQYQPGDEFPVQEFLVILGVGMAFGVLVLLAGAILQPALILATSHARAGTPLRAGEALRAGFDYFGRSLLVALLSIGCGMLLVIMLGLPLVIAFISSVILGVVVALLFIPVAIAAALFLNTAMNYTYRNIVLYNLSVGDGVSKSLEQLSSAKLASLGLCLTAIVIPAIALFPVSMIFAVSQVALLFTGQESGLLMVLYYFFSIVLSIPLAGYFGAFGSVIFTVAHYEWFVRERSGESQVSF